MRDTTSDNDGQALAEFDRGKRDDPSAEVLKIGVREYQGRRFVEARIYYLERSSGAYRPTAKGVTFRAHELAEVEAALKEAIELLTGGGR